ncbi:hypothetical protein B0H17DRAFT_1087299 [Mycena rosella]|uniref:SH3 domain-containing protein n=1 Tax=Mycena rosella TaxID=1033263 RepID=A0AAD7CY42_MYCRO|nr:hypothetical protein B0H17DRAFT_1087299 [Mycena rosella]
MSTTAADLSLASSAPPSPAAKPPIAIRDFAFPSSDARFAGGGPDVPPACDPARLARRLRGEEGAGALSDWEDEGAEDDGDGFEDGGFLLGRGRMTFGPSSSTNDDRDGGDGVGPADFARNFVDDGLYYEEAYDGDAGGEGDGEGEGVEPGLYRAQFAFKAEDAAEMGLAEGQLVHVLGGGAAGWAVARQREPAVVSGLGLLEVHRRVGARGDAGAVWSEMWAEAVAAGAGAGAAGAGAGVGERRALVPESYLVLVRGEGEREEDALERLERYIEWVESERLKQEAELAAEAEGHARTEADSPSSSDYEDAVEGAGA